MLTHREHPSGGVSERQEDSCDTKWNRAYGGVKDVIVRILEQSEWWNNGASMMIVSIGLSKLFCLEGSSNLFVFDVFSSKERSNAEDGTCKDDSSHDNDYS